MRRIRNQKRSMIHENHLYDRKIEEDDISTLDNYLKQEEYDSDSFFLDFMQCEYGECCNISQQVNMDNECFSAVMQMLSDETEGSKNDYTLVEKYNALNWKECEYQVQDEQSDITYLDEVMDQLFDKKIHEYLILRLANHLKQEEYDSDSFYQDLIMQHRYWKDSNIAQQVNLDQECLSVLARL